MTSRVLSHLDCRINDMRQRLEKLYDPHPWFWSHFSITLHIRYFVVHFSR